MIIDHGLIVAEGSPRDLKREVVGDSVVLRVARRRRASVRARCSRDAPFVSEVGAADEEGQLRCYVEDGAAALPELLRLLDAASARAARDQPLRADARRRVPGQDRPLAARRGPATEEVGA